MEFDLPCVSKKENASYKTSFSDLFYQEKAFYGRQDKLDRTITRICDLIGISRTMSNVLSAAKGMVVGSLSITDGSNFVDCSMAPFIITHFSHTSQFHTDAEFILVVEKDTVFQRLLHEGFFQIFSKSILVTGRGYPDALTRLFLQKIMSVHHLPLFGLMDSDPYGVEIAMIYKYGAKKQTTEMGDLSLPSFYWIGISQAESDLLRHPIGPDQFLPLSKTDLKKIKNLMERAKTLNDSRFFEELRRMNENGTKLEIEAISGIAPGYVCEFIKPLIYR